MRPPSSARILRPVLILAAFLLVCLVGTTYLQYLSAGPFAQALSYRAGQILHKDGHQGSVFYSDGAAQEPDREDERPVNVDHITMLSVMLFGTMLALLVGISLFYRWGVVLASVLRPRSPLFIYAGSRRPAPALLEIFRL